MILPNVVRSGRTPRRSCAPPQATRNEITSSKISTIPCRSVIARRRCRKPSAGAISPALQSSGSTMRHARWAASASRICSHASGSFQGSTTTCFRTAGGKPADQATDFGRLRLPPAFGSPPTLTMTQSWVPW